MNEHDQSIRSRKVLRVAIYALLVPMVLAVVFLVVAMNLVDDPVKLELGVAANWFQVLVALWTVSVTALAAIQIFAVQEQTRIARKQADSAAYRPLISPQMQSAKRLINAPKVMEALKHLGGEIDNLPDDSALLRARLETFRSEVAAAGNDLEFPLLGRKACLDDIESLLNEYNYLCNQILNGSLTSDFGTDMALKNFGRTHDRLLPLLKLRRRMAPEYASHYSKFVERSFPEQPPENPWWARRSS